MLDKELLSPSNAGLKANTTLWALDGLPQFPAAATRLMRLLVSEDPDITEVSRMLSSESAYAARLLQLANSPLFALTPRMATLAQAVGTLGLGRMWAITVTRALGDFVAPVLDIRPLRVCWQNSLAGALLAEKLAPACNMDPGLAFVAGLIRDIGRLALLVKYPDAYVNLLLVSAQDAFDPMTTEPALFDVDHCQAGAWLLERMPFPAELREAVAHHHDVPPDTAFRMVHLVRIADRMADALGFAIVEPARPLEFADVLEDLRTAALSRFADDPADLRLHIEAKILSWT